MKRTTMNAIVWAAAAGMGLTAFAMPAMADDTSKITYTYRDDGSDPDNNALRKWVQYTYDNWDKKDQVELDIAPITASEGDYFTKIALQLGDPKTCPDLVSEDTFQLPNDAAAGYLTDLSDYIKKYSDWGQFYESMQNITAVDGVNYGVPYCTDTRGLFYNRSVLEKAGVIAEGEDWQPKSWKDILDACAKIKEAVDDDFGGLGSWSSVFLTGGGLSFNRGGKEYLSGRLGRPVQETPRRTTKLNSHCFSSALGLMDLIIDTIEQQRQPASGAGNRIKDFFRSLLGG